MKTALKCCYCGHIWIPRKVKPRACPHCHRYYTEKRQPIELELTEELEAQLYSSYRVEKVEKEAEGEWGVKCPRCGRIVKRVFATRRGVMCAYCLVELEEGL